MSSRPPPSDPSAPGRTGPASPAPRTLLWGSVAVALVTIVLKTLAWHLTGSVGLLSDALESFVNLAGAVFALAMVTVAQRPADDDHPYGHHKAEYFSSGFEGILIVGASAAIFWAAAHRLSAPQPLEQVGWGLALSVVSSALNGGLAWLMFRSARAHRSVALEGDARHLVTDVWTSAGVVVGIGAASATGWLWLDPVVAMAVALNILREGAHMVWRASQGLMDAAVEPEAQAAIDAALSGFAQGAPQVRFDHLITRQAGQRRFAGLHMHVPAEWSLGRAAQLRGAVETALMRAVPGLRVTIELLPVGVESFLEEPKDCPP
ncbi:cation diffusion facilitator family transporter [Acidovorax sp. NCPPB 3576]|uniref:cation diffusion facilitator family transporter n=1 Tax=Acidovorax sp. NCPPB 3576 TaxID=2940488 RepID=UPI00234BB323|nr:cation diffusion facilitator family transporter [Acidovorax sp. NCPPB 3576]WCM87664.1 cation diffusion facilitator family transporter [Acidovorax sp. NCPPB 3576]